jgi:catechol 2,3-dioxygenase-like lactoylglutathione lyase family enzyme
MLLDTEAAAVSAAAVPRSAVVETEGLHHYTISVADLEEAIGWYGRVLGFKLVYQNERHQWGRVGYMQAPGFLLEILEVPEPKPLPSYAAGPEPDTDLTVCGHKHFALEHASVAQGVAHLETLGEPVLSFKHVSLEGAGEFVGAFLADSTGGLIEMVQDPAAPCQAESGGERKPGPLSIRRLHHIAMCVPDREEAVRWYEDILGFSVATSFEVSAIGLRSAFMQGPEFWLELHCLAGSEPVPPERRDPRTDVQTLGNKYFAVAVKDAARASERLKDAGVEIVATLTSPGIRRVFISDVAGNPIELFQLVN